MGMTGNRNKVNVPIKTKTKIPSIEQIELAIMNSDMFNFRQNLMVFRVSR